MPALLRLGTFLLGFAALLNASQADVMFDVEIPRRDWESFNRAAFHLWLPDHAGPVRGVAVVLDGINVDGRHLAGRAQWQNFARDHSLALVACYFKTDDLSSGVNYCEADLGSGRALLAGLAALGRVSGHPEMETVPLFLLGFSAGGQFSYSFACCYPARVAAFVSNKGGVFATQTSMPALKIPGLFLAGAKESESHREAIRRIFADHRKMGARWCMAIEPKYAHNTANANDVALPFFEGVMRSWDRPPVERNGVVLDVENHRLVPPGVPPREAGQTYWFPDEQALAVWEHFITTPK